MKILRNEFLRIEKGTAETFRYNQFETALLEPDDLIYRIYTPGHNCVGPEDVEDPNTKGMFWLDHTTYESLIKANKGEYIQSFATRSMLAIKEKWNPEMSRIVTARITKSIRAAYGMIKWQTLDAKDGDSNVILMGGGSQLFISLDDMQFVKIIGVRDITPEAKVVNKIRF